MRAMRSRGQPDLTYILVSDSEATGLCRDLRKRKSPFARALRRELKKALRGK